MNEQATILLAEDEVIIRFAAAEALRDEGYVVLEAADAEEALMIFSVAPEIHIVLTDINMPGPLDGLALARRIKLLEPDLPVLLVSAHPPSECEGHADGFIRKPFLFSELVWQIQQLIGPEWMTKPALRNAS